MKYEIPELPLEPPEDTRRVAGECEWCGELIYEGDDCYLLPDGLVCKRCIKECYVPEIEVAEVEDD